MWSLTCPVINASDADITQQVQYPGPQPNAQNKLLGVTGVDIALRDLDQYLFVERLGPLSVAFVMNSRGNLQLHPVLKFFVTYNFEHHQLKVKFSSAFNFVNQTLSKVFYQRLLNRESEVSKVVADLYTNIDLYVYKRKAVFEVFRYRESRFHEMLYIGIAHFSEPILQMDALKDSFFINPSVTSLLARAIESKDLRCGNKTGEPGCFHVYISPWPYCPPKLNLSKANDPTQILTEIQDLMYVGIDASTCDFAHDQHDDSQLLQNLLASLFIVERYLSSPRQSEHTDFVVTFGGASATLNSQLAQSDWWAHVADPKESSLYKRNLLMSDFFGDKNLIMFSTDDEPGHTVAGVKCAGISSREFEYKHGALAVTRLLQSWDLPPFGLYGQVLEHQKLLNQIFNGFDEECGKEKVCYALDEGASVIGFKRKNEREQTQHIHIGDHLSMYNLCLMNALVKYEIYQHYVYEDAFCFCPQEAPQKPKKSVSTRSPSNIFSFIISSALKLLSSIMFAINVLLWSSCQSILVEFFTVIDSSKFVDSKDVLFNFKTEQQQSLCTIAFDKYLYTEKVKSLFGNSKWNLIYSKIPNENGGCSICANEDDYFNLERLDGTNLILISVAVSQDFCAAKQPKPKNYWKKERDLCREKDEQSFSDQKCPSAIHDLEPTGSRDSLYCSSAVHASINIFSILFLKFSFASFLVFIGWNIFIVNLLCKKINFTLSVVLYP